MKIEVGRFEINEYLNGTFDCSCEHFHETKLEEVRIEDNVKNDILAFLKKKQYKSVFVVEDETTKKVYGDTLISFLQEHDILVDHVNLGEGLVPNESSVFATLAAMKNHYDLMVGVGSGTINDLTKFVSHRCNLNYIIVATAPSMDGFASIGAALITDDLKTTYNAHVPQAIFADLEVLKNAPMEMIAAGVGDIIGKYNCLIDWKISHIVTGEYYCETNVEMVRQCMNDVVESIPLIKKRDKQAVKKVMEALVLTGVAMSFVGNSRPASGSEHHVSHYWEMKFQFAHKEPVFHGIKVGIATPGVIHLYKQLAKQNISFEDARSHINGFDYEDWKERIRDKFGPSANGVIALEETAKKNGKEQVLARIDAVEKKWEEIRSVILNELPEASDVVSLLKEAGVVVNPNAFGIDNELVHDAILYAKEVRVRYGLLQMLFDLGLEEAYADAFVAYYEGDL